MCKRWSIAALRGVLLLVALSLACAPEKPASLRGASDASAGTALTVPSGGGATPSVPVLPGQASAPINVAEVIRRVHFAYHPEGDQFAGGHSTYGVRSTANGKASFTPFRYVARDRTAKAGASFQFETSALGRGKESLAVEGSTQVDDDGALVIARSGVVEKLRNDEHGVEQTWTFAEQPHGDGDLVVRLSVSGLEYVAETKAGLHFIDRKTGLGVCYGAASWVDAEGRHFPVASHFADGEIVLKVGAASVAQAGYPAVLDPTISAEYGTDNPVNGAAPGQETSPSVTYGGGNYFVVWEDDRAGVTNVYGARVSTAGVVLDLAGIPIASGTVSAHQNCGGRCGVQVAFDGTNFLVAWLDIRNGATNNDVYGAFVSSGGVLGTTNIAIGTAPADQIYIGIGFDGTNYLVVWTELGTTYNVHGSLVSKTGVLQGTPNFTITTDFEAYAPVVAFDGTNYLVVWDYNGISRREIHGTFVSKTGTLPVPAGFNFSSGGFDQAGATVAYDPTLSNYMIAYQQDMGSSNTDLFFKRVSTAGVVVAADAAGIPISTAAGYQQDASIAFDGANNFFVVWADFRTTPYTTRGARIAKTGTLVDGPAASGGVVIGGAPQFVPVVAFGGGSYLVAWSSDYYNHDIMGSIVTTAASPGAPFAISKTANGQHAPAVAFDGTNYLLVWEDYRPGLTNLDIYGARVSKVGAIQDPSGISIATATGNQVAPAVVFDGSSYYVAWEDHRAADGDIYGSPVSKLGVVGDPIGLKISGTATGDQVSPTVGFNGTDYWVAWEDYRNGSIADIYGARVTTGGTLRDGAGVAICNATLDQKAPSLACDGTNCLVAWQDYRGGASYDIYGARMAPGGGFVGAADTAGIPISAAAFDQKSPAVAFDGNNYFAVWSDARTTGLNPDIYGARISKAGSVLDAAGIAISAAANDQTFPAVAYAGDGVNYLVAWADKRSGTSNDIYASWVSTGGSVLDPAGVIVSNDVKEEIAPSIASEGAGHSLIAYQRFDPLSPFGVERVRARLAYSGTLVGTGCAGGTTCATRFCSESYCCDKACTGACQTCGATPGSCTSVISGADPDHCDTTTSVCDATGACKLKQGQACTPPGSNCLTGYCVDGVCCDKACAGGCDACNASGVCTVALAGNAGANPSCNPGVCDGVSPNCPGGCTSDAGCGAGTYCAAGGSCQPQKAQGQACNLVTDCTEAGCRECNTGGSCVDGFCCDTACAGACDTCSSVPGTCKLLLKAVDGAPSCSPYLCTGTGATCGSTCNDDSECIASNFCDTVSHHCMPDQAPGKSCTSKTQCQSNFCVDGVCCDEACGGTCRACTGALKGGGSDGTCDYIKVGTDPANECAQDNANTCKQDGQCDGAGACRLYVKGISCGATSCVGNNVIGTVCNGFGTCGLDNSGIPCAPYACANANGKCTNPCATSNDCTAGNFCIAGECKPQADLGKTCSIGLECKSNHCVEGICCDTGCNGVCETCLAAHQASGGTDGTCKSVAAGDDPNDNCADDGAGSCKKDGLCDGAGACRLYPKGSSCGAASCAMNSTTSAETYTCNGAGTCETAATDCKPFVCGAGACHTDCMSAADCATAAYCNAGTCQPKKKNGEACTSDSSCTAGFCADGYCCNAACKGQCEACNVMAALGTCVPVSGKPAAGRAVCDATPPADVCTASSCDGTVRDKCAGFVGPTVSCRKAGCTAGVATLTASCNGKGQCPAVQTQMCAPYACDTDACKTACAADADCAGGFKCEATKCVPGATCSDDHTVLSATGTPKDCSPYKCTLGACGTKCASVDDCLTGYACDTNGACVATSAAPPGGAAEDSGGCGCRVPGGEHTSGRSGWVSLLAGVLLLRGRARRVRSRRQSFTKG